jgi:hypothetical protein
MKSLQVGILALLVVVAGLLIMNLRHERAAADAKLVSQAVPPVEPDQVAAAVAEPVTPEVAAPAVQPRPSPRPAAVRKPSPMPAGHPAPVGPPPGSLEPVAAPRPSPAPAAEPEPPAPVVEPAPAPRPSSPHVRPDPVSEAQSRQRALPAEPRTVTIPAGTLLAVRLAETVDTERHQSGDSFRANLDAPLVIDGLVIAERGARVEGKVVEAVPAGRVKGVAQLGVQLTRLDSADGQTIELTTATFAKEGDKDLKGDATKVGVAAGIGAAIGAIAGGGKGAAIGAAAGGAAGTGGVMATRGKPATLETETGRGRSVRETSDPDSWGSLSSCEPVANRLSRRLATAAQDSIPPHNGQSTGMVIS